MKKLVLLLLAASLSAKSSYEIARQLVNNPDYDHKLAVLFSQNDTNPNIKQISQSLKMNGLLNYNYIDSIKQEVNFTANAHASIMLKALASAFEQIGISYYLPSAYAKNGNEISIGFMINSKTMVDPGALYVVLANMGIYMKDASRSNASFYYTLDFSRAHIDAPITLNRTENLKLKKPLDDYFVALNSLKHIIITPSADDIWYPRVLFLDKNLNLISSFISDIRSKKERIEVPLNTSYAIISDKFSLENIKHGLEISGE